VRITNIYIEEFRSIKKIDVRIEELCVFVGENSSGKSTILQAIHWLFNSSKVKDIDFHQ